jgi:hypothetical protein
MSKNENTTFPRRFPTGQFDFVLANPPFNVNAVDKERLKDSVGPGRRFAFGLPRTDNANYLWIPLFYSARPTPRAAPGSSWPTRPPTRAPLSKSCGRSSSGRCEKSAQAVV